MRRVPRVAFLLWFSIVAGGCASITGLDSITEQDCAPNCADAQSRVDVTIPPDQGTSSGGNPDVGPTPDQSSGPDQSSTGETGGGGSEPQPEASGVDGPHDSGEAGNKDGGAPETSTEASADVVVEATADTGVDSACGPTDTLQNCGACGQACASGGTKGVNAGGAGCTGTYCLYSCQAGYLDCNATVGSNTDGCECNVTAAPTGATCCGTACPVEHITGQNLPGALNQDFFDCVPTGSYFTGTVATPTVNVAQDACVAYFGTNDCYLPNECTDTSTDAGTGDWVVCGQTTATSECVCWEYSGPNVGKVTTATGSLLGQCYCPGSNGPGISTYTYH